MAAEVRYRRGDRNRPRLWAIRAGIRKFGWAVLGTLDRLVSKKARRVVLGSDKGLKYSGNPRHLFEHLVGKDGWDPYWLTESPEILQEVNARYPGRALRAWSARALRMGLTSRWLGFSHSKYDLGPFAYLARPRFIYLNHGTPLKTMGYEKAYYDPSVKDTARAFGAITCCSDFEATLWSRAYRLPMDRMWVTGVPRNDRLFTPDPGVLTRLGIPDGRRVILYAPTYRETGPLAEYLPAPALNSRKLVALLERHDAVMLIRPHYYEWQAAADMVKRIGSERFMTADERQVPDVNDLLPIVDVLVTDYSSIYFDFLLLDRPIIFSCHDLDQYERDRGFMIDYNANTPGDKVKNGNDFLSALDRLLRHEDQHRSFRQEIRARFHKHPDNRSAERITECLTRHDYA